jgi:hypothetical protein
MSTPPELIIPGTYNIANISCQLTDNHPQHEDYCQRKVQVIVNTKPETSITANYLKRHGWPSNIQLQIVEKLLPESFTNWLEYMKKEEKRVGILFPAIVKFSFLSHMCQYLDYGWDKKYFFSENLLLGSKESNFKPTSKKKK